MDANKRVLTAPTRRANCMTLLQGGYDLSISTLGVDVRKNLSQLSVMILFMIAITYQILRMQFAM